MCNTIYKTTPRIDRLTALRAACLHIFRQLAQIILEIRRYSCVGFIQADEKSDGAIQYLSAKKLLDGLVLRQSVKCIYINLCKFGTS